MPYEDVYASLWFDLFFYVCLLHVFLRVSYGYHRRTQSVVGPLQDATVDVYDFQTGALLDVRDAINQYLDMVSFVNVEHRQQYNTEL